jgi:hypothetical protein
MSIAWMHGNALPPKAKLKDDVEELVPCSNMYSEQYLFFES